jgi:hypothetical protein
VPTFLLPFPLPQWENDLAAPKLVSTLAYQSRVRDGTREPARSARVCRPHDPVPLQTRPPPAAVATDSSANQALRSGTGTSLDLWPERLGRRSRAENGVAEPPRLLGALPVRMARHCPFDGWRRPIRRRSSLRADLCERPEASCGAPGGTL